LGFDCENIGSPCAYDSCKEACKRDYCNTDCTYVLTGTYANPKFKCYNEEDVKGKEYQKQITFEECINNDFYPRFYKKKFALCTKCTSSKDECSEIKQSDNFEIPDAELEKACEADICGLDCSYYNNECYGKMTYSENCDDGDDKITDKSVCRTKLESLPSKFDWNHGIVNISITIEGINWQYWGNNVGREDGTHYWMRDDSSPCPGDLIFDTSVSEGYFICSTDPNFVNSNIGDAKPTSFIESAFLE